VQCSVGFYADFAATASSRVGRDRDCAIAIWIDAAPAPAQGKESAVCVCLSDPSAFDVCSHQASASACVPVSGREERVLPALANVRAGDSAVTSLPLVRARGVPDVRCAVESAIGNAVVQSVLQVGVHVRVGSRMAPLLFLCGLLDRPSPPSHTSLAKLPLPEAPFCVRPFLHLAVFC